MAVRILGAAFGILFTVAGPVVLLWALLGQTSMRIVGWWWLTVLVALYGVVLLAGGLRLLCRRPWRYVAMVLLATAYLFPAYWMVSTSLKEEKETQKTLVPARPRIANYGEAMAFKHGKTDVLLSREPVWKMFFRTPFFRQLCNTLTIGLLGTVGVVISSSLAAYAFARLRWPGRDLFFFLTVVTMMVPFAVKVVPLYGLFRGLGWMNTLKPLWAPACFGTGFSIFLLRQFFKGIPTDLTDAARIDGCSEFAIYWRVILPLARPALAAVALFHFLYIWNDFFAPLVFLTRTEHFTLALGLHQFQATHGGGTPWTLMMAAATLITLPVIIIFFFTQRFFVQGVTMTGMKG
ncbi:MAG: carbohydrate ABC transporter permease [Planctomycetota bacterium]